MRRSCPPQSRFVRQSTSEVEAVTARLPRAVVVRHAVVASPIFSMKVAIVRFNAIFSPWFHTRPR